MASHAQNTTYSDSTRQGHLPHRCSKNMSLDRSLVAKLGEECTCAEESGLESPGSASITDYCAEVGGPCTPAGASISGFSPFIVQSNEWAGSGQRSVHASPYSPCPANKADRSYTFTPGSQSMERKPNSSENQSSHSPTSNVLFRNDSEEICSDEMVSKGTGAFPSNHVVPLAPALGLGELQHCRQASSDSVRRYLDSLPGDTTYGSGQDDCSDYMTEDSAGEDSAGEDSAGEDTSAYSQSNSTFDALIETIYKSSELNVDEVSAAILEAAKCALTNQLMREFWVRFDKNWMGKFTTCAANETTSNPPSSQKASSSAQVNIPKRQRRENDDDKSSSDEDGRAHKRSIPQKMPPEGENFALSCPFRKYDSQKYRIPDYRACALSSWKTIGRVKEHVYRCHRMPVHCRRCWTIFKSDDLLLSHIRAEANGCTIHPQQVIDGITPETERLLKSRKKEYRGQSEPELWKKMYRIIFPHAIVPSPFHYCISLCDLSSNQGLTKKDYEAIRDEHAIDQEYLRRELPRLVMSRLMSVIGMEFGAVKEKLQTLLHEIIQDSINQLLTNYETARAASNAAVLQPPVAIRTNIQFMSSGVVRTHKQNDSISSVGSIPELQPTFELFNILDQSPKQPTTPRDSALLTEYYPADDIHSAYKNQDPPFHCFCPLNACSCPGRQKQVEILPPAAFEINTPEKRREKRTLTEELNMEEPLATVDLEEDDSSMDWFLRAFSDHNF